MAGFEGMDQLIADLRAIDGRVIDDVAQPALRMAGRAAVQIAKAVAPVRSGLFRESIHVGGDEGSSEDFRPGAGGRGGYQDYGVQGRTWTHASVVVGTTLFYAPWVEFGGPRNPALRPVGQGVDAVDGGGNGMLKDALEDGMAAMLARLGF